jgi:transglutaminase-like putative cysteine protease
MSTIIDFDPMRVQRLFRLATYVTLTVACAGLVWAEYDIVPAILVIAAVTMPLILVAYRVEGRWSMPVWAANVLGVLIFVGMMAWMLLESIGPEHEDPMKKMRLPWPTNLVPLLGPMLLLLLPVKLFRPKSVGDHWGLQVIGLACIGLACATVSMDDPGIFASLLLAYLLLSLWCLALFFLYRERQVRPAAEQPKTPRLRQVLSWAVPIFAVALVIFFTLPRSTAVWQVRQSDQRLESGATEESGLDLSRTGTLMLDPEVAFEVFASNDEEGNSPKLDLSTEQRWRGPVFRYYHGGSWKSKSPSGLMPALPEAAIPTITRGLPTYPDSYYLTYLVKTRIGPTPFVADPVYQPSSRPVPIVQLLNNGSQLNWIVDPGGTLKPSSRDNASKPGTRYRQVTIDPPAPGLGHAISREWCEAYERDLRAPPPNFPELSTLRDFTEKLLMQLSKPGSYLSPEVLKQQDPVTKEFKVKHFEQIARALEIHLAASGVYKYSLTLDRSNPYMDPTLDFLFNMKTGHCNRFASALGLMLRSLEIPCQLVSGFRGADPRGDGHYEVRQCYAHTWVEVLVTRREPDPAHKMHLGDETYHWLTLDPTPAQAGDEARQANTNLFGMDINVRKMYRDLIFNFTAENRDEFFINLGKAGKSIVMAFGNAVTARTPDGLRLRTITALVVALVITGMLFASRWLRRRLRRWGLWRAGPFPGTGFYQRLLTVLGRHGLRPAASQTPREFADTVALSLTGRNDGAMLADVVRRAADLFYRVRFGGRPLSGDETRDVDTQIERLAVALAAGN